MNDTASPVRVYFREPAPSCAPGTADCNSDPTDGCETNVTLSGGACTPVGTTCRKLLAANPGLPSGAYLLDTDGPGPARPVPVHCEMTADGGGWTGMYAGKNGGANIFDAFDTGYHAGTSLDPAGRYLRRKPVWASITGVEIGVSCGAAMVKIPATAAMDAYFSRGQQGPSWLTLTGATVISGTVPYPPDRLWSGNGADRGFIFTHSSSTGTRTFASGYPNTGSATYNQCNAVADTTSLVRVYFREPVAAACAAGTSDCDGDPTNGCETNDQYTLGACVGQPSCADLHRNHPAAPSGSYLIDTDGAGPMRALMVRCDMTTDGGGYTWLKVSELDLAADQNAYAKKCAEVGMEIVVPQTKAHAQAIYTWNGNQPPNLVNVFPKRPSAATLYNWNAVCRGAPCPFWLTDNASGLVCTSGEPNGNGLTNYRLYRTGAGCGIEGLWADSANTVSIQDYVVCSTNDRPPRGARERPTRTATASDVNGCETTLASSVAALRHLRQPCARRERHPGVQRGHLRGRRLRGAGFGDCDGHYGDRLRDGRARERGLTAARAATPVRRERQRRRPPASPERASSPATPASTTATSTARTAARPSSPPRWPTAAAAGRPAPSRTARPPAWPGSAASRPATPASTTAIRTTRTAARPSSRPTTPTAASAASPAAACRTPPVCASPAPAPTSAAPAGATATASWPMAARRPAAAT